MAAIRTLAEIPTLTSLYASKTLRAAAEPVVTKPSATLNNIISHIRYDITKLEVDCIVNAANSRLAGGGGVDGAIHAAAGPELLEECRTLNGCPTGQAKITNAYRLPCKKVIHAVGPVYHREQDPEKLLRSCYRNSLQLAVQHGLKSIAFSAISTGVYGYPSDEAADAAIDEVREFLLRDNNASLLERVIFCSFMPKDVQAYEETLPYVLSFLYFRCVQLILIGIIEFISLPSKNRPQRSGQRTRTTVTNHLPFLLCLCVPTDQRLKSGCMQFFNRCRHYRPE